MGDKEDLSLPGRPVIRKMPAKRLKTPTLTPPSPTKASTEPRKPRKKQSPKARAASLRNLAKARAARGG